MVYYPLTILILSGIREILIITTSEYINLYRSLLKDGRHLGISLKYKVQNLPRGIADAFLIGEEFIGEDNVTLILGDNLFYGSQLGNVLRDAIKNIQDCQGSHIFGYYVKNPKHFGVIEFGADDRVISLEEKPTIPKSNYIIPGLYIYDNKVINYSKLIKPSDRGE